MTQDPNISTERRVTALIIACMLAIVLLGLGVLVWWWSHTSSPVVIRPTRPRPTPGITPRPLPPNASLTTTARRRTPPTVRPPTSRPAPPPLAPALAEAPAPLLITMQLKGANPESAFSEFSTKSGLNLAAAYPGIWDQVDSNRITLSATQKPLWEIFDQLCRQSGLTPEVRYGSSDLRTIRLTRAPDIAKSPPAIIQGPCMILLKRLTHTARVELAGRQPPRDELTATLTVLAQPSLSILSIAPTAFVETAIDDQNRSLLSGIRRTTLQPTGTFISDVTASLRNPQLDAQRIAKLKGYVSILTQSKPREMPIQEPLTSRNRTQSFDAMDVTFREMHKIGANYRARITFTFKNAAMLQSGLYKQPQMLRLVDSSNHEFNRINTAVYTTSSGFELHAYFSENSPQSAPATLIVTVPSDLHELRIPFEFKDVPLPQ